MVSTVNHTAGKLLLESVSKDLYGGRLFTCCIILVVPMYGRRPNPNQPITLTLTLTLTRNLTRTETGQKRARNKRGCAAFASNEKIRPTILNSDHDYDVRITFMQLSRQKNLPKRSLPPDCNVSYSKAGASG